MAYLHKHTPVVVDWLDAWSDGEAWESVDHKPVGDVNVRSIGYVFKHDKKGILLYTSATSEGSVGGFHFVPKGMIKQITQI